LLSSGYETVRWLQGQTWSSSHISLYLCVLTASLLERCEAGVWGPEWIQ
jgi:hypothetical protein